MVNSKFQFLPNPQIFWHIYGEIHYRKLSMQQFSQNQLIFWKERQFFVVEN